MKVVKLPSSLWWTWLSSLVLLFMMSLYRLSLMFVFASKWGFWQKWEVIAIGFLNDLGVVAVVSIIVVLLGLIPALHPYKKRLGKKTAMIVFGLFGFLFAFLNLVDLVFIRDFERRPVWSDLQKLFENGSEAFAFKGSFPILYVFIILAITLWAWWLILRWLHKVSGGFARADDRKSRKLWQGITITFCFTFVVFGIIQQKNSLGTGEVWKDDQTTLKYNTLQVMLKKK